MKRRTFVGLMSALFGAGPSLASEPVPSVRLGDVGKRLYPGFVDREQIKPRAPAMDTVTEAELRQSLRDGTMRFGHYWSPSIRVSLPGGRGRWYDTLYGKKEDR
jgi:hypothetical protein